MAQPRQAPSFGGDAVIIGAGTIGLAIAFELAERGAVVRVVDRGEPARAASWAAAGMLAPYSETVREPALIELCAASLREYPAFVERVRNASGIDPHLHLNGVVHAAPDAQWFERFRKYAASLQRRGVQCALLEREALLRTEPWIGSSVVGGLVIAGEGYVDNRRLGRALVAACEVRGVGIEQNPHVRVECDSRRVLGVRTSRGFMAAGAVVNACGAWSSEVPGIPPRCAVPVEPVKGQMLALATPAGLVTRATWAPGAYLVPREDGRLLVGATVERVGFDERVTADGVHALLHAALAAAPALANFAVTESWTGFRPATQDGLPFLGAATLDGLFVATGHYRNGILLAPATARLVAGAIAGENLPELAPFSPARLGTEAARPSRMTHV